MGTALWLQFDEDPFVDSSGQNKEVTNSGVTSAGVFDGSDTLTIDKANVWNPGGGEFAADLRVAHVNTNGIQTYIGQFEDANNNWCLRHIPNNGVNFFYKRNGQTVMNLSGASGEITDTNEHHVAVSQADDTYKLFLDGAIVAELPTTLVGGTPLIDSDLYVGSVSGASDWFNGTAANLRMSKGTQRFINQFTPQTSGSYETDSNTHLLITFTTTGGPEDEAEAGLAVWNPEQVIHGNRDVGTRIVRFGDFSGYFPGTQDGFAPYAIQIPDHPNWNIGDDDFTLEARVRPLSHFNWAGIIHQSTRWYWYIDSAGKLNLYIEDGGPPTFSMQSSGTVPLDEWSHIALTRTLGPTGGGNEPLDIYMHPDGPVSGTFLTVGGCVGWDCMNNGIFDGTPNDSTYVEMLSDDNIRVTFDSPAFIGTSTQIKVHTRGRATGSPGSAMDVRLYSDGVSLDGSDNVSYPLGSFANRTSTFSVAKTYAQLTNLEVRLYGGAPSFEDEISELEVEIVGPTQGLPIPVGIGQVWRMYINGIIQNTTTENFTIPNLSGPFWVGRGTSPVDLFHGFMDQLRLFLGKAIWTKDRFWPLDYKYLDEPFTLYVPTYRRRIHSIK